MLTLNGKIENAKLIKDYLINLAKNGKLYIAMGSGNANWDSSLPAISQNTTKLQDEVVRVKVEPTDICMVQESSSNPDEDIISENSSTIRVLGNIVCPLKPLRECGLFINGTDEKDSGTIYSYSIHNKVVLGQLNLYMKYIYIKL